MFAPPTEFPPIEAHGVIGDRRSAALVAADGTIDWLSWPDYDDPCLFASLLDPARGGFWQLGPATPAPGEQQYMPDTAVLVTRWHLDGAVLSLVDFMADPGYPRASDEERRRVVLRRLRCEAGAVPVRMRIAAHPGFASGAAWSGDEVPRLALAHGTLAAWASRPLALDEGTPALDTTLRAGETLWAVLSWEADIGAWSETRCEAALARTLAYWEGYRGSLTYDGPHAHLVMRSAIAAHLLTYAPTGALVAAATASLPERVGGDLNWDYRFCWVRDTSIVLAGQALLGDLPAVARFLDWLVTLGSSTGAPLQVVYHVDGRTDLAVEERPELMGYRGSRPVRFGNRAAGQTQFDSLGYLADLMALYVALGGEWKPAYTVLLRRAADHVAARWPEPDAGIWELPVKAHHTSSRVMSWVTLDRAAHLAERLHLPVDAARWRRERDAIHAEVLAHAWRPDQQAFCGTYETAGLDASTLLVGLVGFLPPDHPRVLASAGQIARRLSIDGWVHRFDPRSTPGVEPLPMGAFEGAFLPCTFWLAHTLALAGRTQEAETLLARGERLAGGLGLLSEELDTRTGHFLGNTPQLFSHATFVRAALALGRRAA